VDADEAYRSLAAGLRRCDERADQAERSLAEVRERVDQLVSVLIGKGVLSEGHRALFDRAAEKATRRVRPRVRLRQFVDKYAMPGIDIDCAALIHLCRARCCAFSFELTTQDLDEGRIAWEVDDPYLIRHEIDGYCTHIDRKNGQCREHARRPATCRGYDCRGDPRVWVDFEARIPAPLSEGLSAPSFAKRRTRCDQL
jgi:hypothetical protein